MTTTDTSRWQKPQHIDPMTMAFPASVVKDLMPAYADIPDEFKRGHTKWNRMQSDWFFSGLKKDKWTPKEGIDTPEALRHLATIQGSWEPKHEHKEAAVAYLASLWFEDVTYEGQK